LKTNVIYINESHLRVSGSVKTGEKNANPEAFAAKTSRFMNKRG